MIQFQNAELIGEHTYRLSKLLRGRQGTESFITSHQPGTRFVLLSPSLHATTMTSNMIGRTIHYKAVTIGNALGNTLEQAFIYKGNCLKPFAPVHITGIRDNNGNLTISWIRRSRVDNDWRDGVDIPIGEESEKYQVDIIADDVVVRTLEVSVPTAIYTVDNQIADFKKIQNNITVKIYQLSAVIGRGYPTTVKI